MTNTIRDVTRLAREHQARYLDLKFTDLPGLWQHFSIPIESLDEDLVLEGVGFDGSSIRGFQTIEESDMLLQPDLDTVFLDPFFDDPTLSFICNVKDPLGSAPYTKDPRFVAKKAERYVLGSGIADTAYFGPEPEFYIFDDVRFDQTYNAGFYRIDSSEGFWNSGRDEQPNLGYKPRYKEGYFPTMPMDSLQNLRAKMMTVMRQIGVTAEVHHHEVGTGGQAEIDIRFDRLALTADNVMKFKYVVKNVARRYGKTATFMPKPIYMDNGSGMHVHQSLWQAGRNLFYEPNGDDDLSALARHYIAGLLTHAASVLAFSAPSTNSYRRLVPGYEAPVNLAYSRRNRSACVRIPMYSKSEKAKRIEFRPPDGSCNPYLAFAAMLMAGVDGIVRRIEPPPPLDKNLYALTPEEQAQIQSTPATLGGAIDALEDDHDYLLRGDVFTTDVIETWIDYKRERELAMVGERPHPAEFALYFDI